MTVAEGQSNAYVDNLLHAEDEWEFTILELTGGQFCMGIIEESLVPVLNIDSQHTFSERGVMVCNNN